MEPHEIVMRVRDKGIIIYFTTGGVTMGWMWLMDAAHLKHDLSNWVWYGQLPFEAMKGIPK